MPRLSPGPPAVPLAEAGPDGGGEALAALAGRNGTVPGLDTPDGAGEPAGLPAPF